MKEFILIIVMFMVSGCSQHKITLLADPKVLAIPIQENGDPLTDLRDQDIILFGPSPEIPNNKDYTKIRRSIYEKLVEAQKLLPEGLEFCLYEGYRSLELQEKLFNDRYQELKKTHPNWNHEKLFIETTKLVSPVINLDGSKNIPPHSTGAAIDVYLVDQNGKPVDMGILVEDWMKDLEGTLSLTDSQKISPEAQTNRKIMGEVLTKAGFVNYPTEYWHWAYGDRYWAYHKKEPYALYGTVK